MVTSEYILHKEDQKKVSKQSIKTKMSKIGVLKKDKTKHWSYS